MQDLVVCSEYLTTLSKQMHAWQSDELEPAIAAVPADWTTAGITLLAVGGAATVGGIAGKFALSKKFDALMEKNFTVKKFSFTGQEAYNIGQLANAGYTIYLQLSSGNYWGASLAVLDTIPQIIEIYSIRSGFKQKVEAAGAVTKILEYTGFGLSGADLCFGPAGALGNVSAGLGLDSDEGEVFVAGAEQFVEGGEDLHTFMPDDSEWSGAAATAYAEDIRELQQIMNDMAAADEQIATVLEMEMGQLELTHNLIGTANTAVGLAIPAALALYIVPEIGPEMSKAFQIAVSFAATVTAIVAMANQLNLCYHNGKEMDADGERYRAAKNRADALYRKLDTPAPGVGTPPNSSDARVYRGAAQSSQGDVARQSTPAGGPGVAGGAGEAPPVPVGAGDVGPVAWGGESGGSAGVGTPGGVVGGMSLVGSVGSGPGGGSTSQATRTPRPAASGRPGEGPAEEAGAAAAGAGLGAGAGAGVTGAERAPVDETAASEGAPRGSTL